MLCEECGSREASISISVIREGETSVRHLCHECAQKLHAVSGLQIRDILSTILNGITVAARARIQENGEEKKEEEAAEGPSPEPKTEVMLAENRVHVVCEHCGMPLKDFIRTGRLGCPQCYGAFREEIQPMMQQIHGQVQHAGRVPLQSEAAQRSRLLQEQLRRRMEQAVQMEDFETAAELRDQLRAMAAREVKVES